MKKLFIICSYIIMIFQFSIISSNAAEKTVQVSLPAFKVQINGILIDSKTSEHPLLLYKNITYMPMTYDYCNLLGFESNWTKESGLVIAQRKGNSIPTVSEDSLKCNNPSKVTASIANTAIMINSRKVDNQKEPYPFLIYKDVTYFPLTYKFTHEEFNIYALYTPEYGLGVFSENKFFYQYNPTDSKLQYVDLRISSILYETTAINISDGTGKYPSNNVKQYSYWKATPLCPNYTDIKYYGYLPDGSGGLKVNTDSKLSIGDLITTVISDPKNPDTVQVVLNFAQYNN